MSVTVHAPHLSWAQTHRALLAIVLLCVALAAATGVFVARAVSDGAPSTTTVTDLQPIDDGCTSAHAGQAC